MNIKAGQLQEFCESIQVTLVGAREMLVGSNSLKETMRYIWPGYRYARIICNLQVTLMKIIILNFFSEK